MRPLEELIDQTDPAWPLVQQWAREATNHVEILPGPDQRIREKELLAAQVTTRSPMGAIVFETGGILVDHSWLRILGAGHPRLPRSLSAWNLGRSISGTGERHSFLLIGDDAAGGFFALDGGALGAKQGEVCYYAPDSLAWEGTKLSYTEFLVWSFSGNLAGFYETFRWSTWKDETTKLSGDQCFSIYPPLWAAGEPVCERERRHINVSEVYSLTVAKPA